MRPQYVMLHFLMLLLALPGLGALQAARAAPEYRVTVVGPPDSRANGINNAGVVVGMYPANASLQRGFMSRGRGWIDLGAIGVSSSATAINDKGQIVGNWRTADGQGRGVIWYRGERRDIGKVPGSAGTRFRGINNAGYTVALAVVNDIQRSFLRTPGGAYHDLGDLSPVPTSITEGHAINNRSQITGASGEFSTPEIPFRAFLWTRGVLLDLGDAGLTPNEGNDINDRGQVTGYVAVSEDTHSRIAFIYTNGRLQDIDGRPAGSGRYSQGQGINNLGHAVGDSNHLSGWVYRGRRMQSINALIDPASGWRIQLPRDINDAGQIAATGERNGQLYAVRLDPIRPSLDAMPEIEADAGLPPLDPPLSLAQAAVEARLDAEAQAREIVHPVQQ
jgi:hypothetical protein